MSVKFGRKNKFIEHDKPEGTKSVPERKKQNKKKIIILVCLTAVVLAGVSIGCAYLFNAGLGIFSINAQVTVSFDSTGGSEVESITIPKGEKLTEVASSSRSGYVFAGWYYEEAPVNAYSEDDVFNQDTILYAGWYQPKIESDIEEYIKDCDSDMTFLVHSDVELTDGNLSDYISFSCMEGKDGSTVSVQPQNDGYLLYSKDGFTAGLTYSIEILDTKNIYFVKAGNENVSDSGIKTYNFTVYKENVNNVVMKADPKLLSSNDVADFETAGEVADGTTDNENDNGKTIYRLTLANGNGNYQAGDIVSLGDGEEDAPENQYYKVIDVINNDTGQYLDLITPDLNDIYSQFEVYYSGDAAHFEDVEEDEETRAIEQNIQTSLKKSKGYDYVCRSIASGIKNSPTLLKTVSTMSRRSRAQFEELDINGLVDLLKNVTVSVKIQKSYDDMGNENGIRGCLSFSTGDIGIKLDENIKLTINLSMTNDIEELAQGYVTNNRDLSLNINQWGRLTNHCNISFSAVIATSSGEKINITEEIQKLIDSQSDDKTQEIVDNMNAENLFGDDLGYVTILDEELGSKTVSIYHVLTIQFKLNFHVDIGMRVGLTLNFDSTEVRKVGLCNMKELTGQRGMVSINERLSSNTTFSATLKGQVGIRAGFKAEVNFSLIHLNAVANFGFTIDIGVYEEITGYVRFDYSSSEGMHLSGGIKSETGIYAELDFTWDLFGWDGSVAIAKLKFPILTIGALEFASEFDETNSAVTFNTTSYNIKNSNDDLLQLKYIDIDTSGGGATINIKPASLSGDYAFFLTQDQTGKGGKDDSEYVSVDHETGMVTIEDGAPDRLDFTVVVQYTKGYSLFSKGSDPIIKNINCTYLKYQVEDSTQKYKATFYMPDGSVLEQKEYYVGQIPVAPDESTYEDKLEFSKYTVTDWSKPWKESFTAIYADTGYHMNAELNYKNITFYGNVYDANTGVYQYGVIAVVPTLCGEVPVPPEVNDADWGWKFDSWSPELREVQTDCNYTAVYRQSDDVCWTSFYADNTIITAGFVEKGTMPEAPDMNAYNTEDQQFAGWWPALHASIGNSETYFAVFRKYVNVTFEDREDNVISRQRVLAGTTPEAPEVDDAVEGEEDYYEYHFSHWATEGGMKLGNVYGDTVYVPVYDTKYLEVTTIFDAGEYTFEDGTSIKEYSGTYAPYNFLYMPQVTCRDNENTYTVDYWISTEKVNGSYVKLYMSQFYTGYKYNLTFAPVFKTGEPIEYTVRFSGGDTDIYLTGCYGELITSDMLTGLTKTSAINNYYYKLTDYGLALPYRFGATMGSDGMPDMYIVAKATFTLVGVDKTFTFDANGGKFSGSETVKSVTAHYGSHCSFTDEPQKTADNEYTYEFAGWAYEKDAITGMDFSDFIINGNSTLYAVYTKTLRNYTVTFDAGEGYFTGGASKVIQSYHYGDTIMQPEDPTRDEDATYRYLFIGWQPVLPSGATVTSSVTFTAAYRTIRIDGTLEETGIIVTDGSSYEDISVGSIPGYTYELVGPEYVPTLTVTGNGLTFSGGSDEVCVSIGNSATDVTFDDLTLSGAYSESGVLVTANTTSGLSIRISGVCVLSNTQDAEQGVRFERPTLLSGVGSGASLTISAKGNYTVYCADDFDVDSLELEINSTNTAVGNDEVAGEEWRFTDSTVRLNAANAACGTMQDITLDDSNLTAVGEDGIFCVNMTVSGASAVEVTARGEDATAVGMMNDLVFADFTGSLCASSTNSTSAGIAVAAYGNIEFKEGGAVVSDDGYDLGGAQIASFEDAYSGTYSSFGIDSGGTLIPVSTVAVTKS